MDHGQAQTNTDSPAHVFSEGFCVDKLWDISVTWNTTDPDFTRCFQQTVLIWIPVGLLWLALPWRGYQALHSRFKVRKWTWLPVTKLILSVGLLATCVAEMSYVAYMWNTNGTAFMPSSDLVGPLLMASAYLLSIFFIYADQKAARPSSAVLFFFWLLTLLTSVIQFRTAVRHAAADPDEPDVFRLCICAIGLPMVLSQFLLTFPSQRFPERLATGTKPSPEQFASFPSRLMFWWFTSMAALGWKKSLEHTDLWDLRHDDQAEFTALKIEKFWLKELESSRKTGKDPSLVGPWFKSIWATLLVSGILRLAADLVTFVPPQLLQLLIAFVTDASIPEWQGYLYAVTMLLATFTLTLINAAQFGQAFRLFMRSKAGFAGVIYRKTLRITSAAKRSSTVGEIVNLMAVDSGKISELALWLHGLWSSPLQIGLALYFLYAQLGPSVFAGLGFMIILIPLNAFLGSKERVYQTAQMKQKDTRMKATNEALSGMKVLKLYAWEESFQKQILDVRDEELKSLRYSIYLQTVSNFTWNLSPFLVALITFATYVMIDEKNVLDSQKAFVSLSLFNILKGPLTGLPFMISSIIQNRVSLARVKKFLNNEDLSNDNVRVLEASEREPSSTAVSVKNGNFSWGKNDVAGLKNINLEVLQGQLVAVVGKVGSGKSSLLAAMLGLMEKNSGQVTLKGTASYVSQQAWIQNMSVEKNILYGKPMDEQRYRAVIKACAMEPDLEMFPSGDQTEIGEKGVNISGGQKQRVSLARALYSNADVCFLDDPLSAVDAHVGKHLFKEAIGPSGLLAGKTRILVTHGISFLSKADLIVTLDNGAVSEMGTYEQLLAKNGAFAELLRTYLVEASGENQAESDSVSLQSTEENAEKRSRSGSGASIRKIQRAFSRSISKKSQAPSEKKVDASPAPKAPVLIADEKTEIGAVKFSVLLTYMRYATLPVFVTAVFGFAAYNGLNVGTTVWLGEWSEDGYDPVKRADTSLRDYRLGVYGAFGAIQALCYCFASLILAHGELQASKRLHQGMLLRIFRAPMSFFDTTPLGRIVNRFSKDIETIDVMLPAMLVGWLQCTLGVLATVIMICVNIPLFAIVLLPLAAIYFIAQRFYIATSRQLKRLESVTRSPIFSHFQESIAGTSTIIATRQTERFIAENDARIDNNNTAYFPNMISTRWLAIMLETVGNLMTFFAALFAVVGRSRGWVEPKDIGMSLTYTLSANILLNWAVRTTSELESHMVSVERVVQYTETPVEDEWVMPDRRPPADWPQAGRVEFADYQTRYRPGLDLVLKGVNADIKAGEKVGIVGRTGAGKSSLTLALFRIIEPAGGRIVIDGIDLRTIGLHDVRSHITIIPQEPVLFSGSLRMNLDPFSTFSDENVWGSLESAHLKAFVGTLPDGLEHQIAEGGENLSSPGISGLGCSVGQRQLVCLARALLRKTKILVLDEATAAIDLQTDELIQRTIREKFADCTVLTIAHRLNTVMDSTRVMVMDQGKIAEFGSPKSLLENRQSVFYGLAKDAGLV